MIRLEMVLCREKKGDKNMGISILIFAAIIEVAFGIYCIITKSNHKKIRSWIRISTFITFIILTLTSLIQWSFRWYLLAAILLICTIISGVSLIRKKKEKKEYKAIGVVIKGATMWMILAIAVIPALIFPQFKLFEMTGGYRVNTVVFTYIDKSRIETFRDTGENRKVTTQFWYPANAEGRYPLVVFSHGAFGISDSNMSTYRELASNGYVVASLSHPYHSMYTIDADGNLTIGDKSFIQEIIDVNNGVYDKETGYKLSQKWLEVRTQDMSFVLDTIIKNAKDNSSEPVYHLIDTDTIGLIGHSLGGAASVQLGRERDDIDAVINLDGDLLGEEVDFVDGEYIINHEIYPVPILGIYTDDMMKLMESVNDSDIVIPQKLISATAANAYEVYITGTNHMSVTDLPLFSPFLVNMISSSIEKSENGHGADKYYVIKTMNRIVLEFFDCYLKGKGSFQSEGTY